VTVAPYFHFGFLVNDLEPAMERFGDVMGLTWTEPTTAHADFWQAGKGTAPVALDVVYSTEGPVHIELLRAHGDGLYRPELAEGFHHIGVWEPDCEGRQEELKTKGLDPIATQYTPQQEIIVSYFDPAALHGVILEIVDEGRRPMMERWFAGESFVD
jgi:hypothetical protein